MSIKCPCHLTEEHGAAAPPRHSSCFWGVMTGPPRKEEGGCQDFGWTGEGGDCHQIGCWVAAGDSWEPPGPVIVEWVQVLSRQAGVAPNFHTQPPRRRGERQEVRPPSGPAGLRSDGCWRTERDIIMWNKQVVQVKCLRARCLKTFLILLLLVWLTGVEAGLDNQAGGGGEQEDGHAHCCCGHAGHRIVGPVVRVHVRAFWGGQRQMLRKEFKHRHTTHNNKLTVKHQHDTFPAILCGCRVFSDNETTYFNIKLGARNFIHFLIIIKEEKN